MMMLKKLEGINIEVLKELSETHEELNYSKFYMEKTFSRETGETIYQYIKGRRLTLPVYCNLIFLGQ